MTKLKLLHAFTILSVLTATHAQAHGIEGREVAAQRWSAACMTGRGPGVCGESMRVHGARNSPAGKTTALSHEVDAPHWNGGGQTHDDWPANMIQG
jgi:hypothetical protein